MLTTKTILAIAAIGSVFFLYLAYKTFQWRRKARKRPPEPRRRSNIKAAAAKKAQTAASEPASTAPATHTLATLTQAPPRQESKFSSGPSVFEQVDEEIPYAEANDYRFGPFTRVLASLLPVSESGRRDLTKSLRNAGYYEPHAWHNFAAVRYLGLVLPILFFGTLLVLVPTPLEPFIIAMLVVAPIMGWALPALSVRGRAAKRLSEIENGLPDMLDLLNMCISQGMTVPSALDRVSYEIDPIYPALGKELHIVTEQARVGSLMQSMTNFSQRVDVADVHSFTSLMMQTEQLGTSVSESLEEYSDSMRETLRQRTEQKANSAAFKMLFPTVLCLMPAVMLFLMGPALIELNRFFAGGGFNSLNANVENIVNENRAAGN